MNPQVFRLYGRGSLKGAAGVCHTARVCHSATAPLQRSGCSVQVYGNKPCWFRSDGLRQRSPPLPAPFAPRVTPHPQVTVVSQQSPDGLQQGDTRGVCCAWLRGDPHDRDALVAAGAAKADAVILAGRPLGWVG